MSSPRPINRSRQRRDPPSCQMCRVKKLKCDRQRPCSNCRTRRLSCNYSRELATTAIPVAGHSDGDLKAQNDALQARVSRLEKAVFGEGAAEASTTRRDLRTKSSSRSEQEALHHSIPRTHHQPNGSDTRNLDPVSPNVNKESLRVHLRSADQLIFYADHQRKIGDISLPTQDIVIACLDLFETHLDGIQAVMHLPSVRDMVGRMYDNNSAGVPLNSGAIALVLAICASMGAWELDWDFLFPGSPSTARVSAFITQEALSALEHVRVSSQISIEAVQATILLTFQFCHFEGLSPHTRLLHTSAFTMARELGLHRIDAPGSERLDAAQVNAIEPEVSRKVWWHLVSTDWLFAYNGGPNEGVYSLQPQHMVVKLPRNINHDDLAIRDVTFTRSDKEPTVMSFHLQRIKIAMVCREVMDKIWNSPVIPDPERLDYGKVEALDAKFQDIINGLPAFLQLNGAAYPLTDNADTWRMAVQRATINLMVHARRCKLHLPFLIHYKNDARYKHSRSTCLMSARKVFEVRERVKAEETLQGFVAFLNLGGQLSHVFYASFVLVMDLCVNRSDNQEDQFSEVHDAIKVMEEARTSSRIASSCYDSLMEILRKHQVNLPSLAIVAGRGKGSHDISVDHHSEHTGHAPDVQGSSTVTDSDLDIVNGGDMSEDIWQDYLFNGSSLDPQSWEAVLNDLGMHIV